MVTTLPSNGLNSSLLKELKQYLPRHSPPVWLLVCFPVRRAPLPGEQRPTPCQSLPLSWAGAAPALLGCLVPVGTGTWAWRGRGTRRGRLSTAGSGSPAEPPRKRPSTGRLHLLAAALFPPQSLWIKRVKEHKGDPPSSKKTLQRQLAKSASAAIFTSLSCRDSVHVPASQVVTQVDEPGQRTAKKPATDERKHATEMVYSWHNKQEEEDFIGYPLWRIWWLVPCHLRNTSTGEYIRLGSNYVYLIRILIK